MLCTPAIKLDVWKVAFPLLSVPVPRVVVPSRNVTDPVGVPEFADTVPVKVTGCPTSVVAAEDITLDVLLDLVGGGVLLDPPPQPTKKNDIARASTARKLQRLPFLLKLPATNMPSTPTPFRLANNIAELPECEFF